MKIGIDISQIVYKGTGVARFTEGLANYIIDSDKKNGWLFFFSSLRKNLDSKLEKKILERGHRLLKLKLPTTALSILFNDLHSFSKLLTFNFGLLNSLDWFITSDWTEPPLPVKKATVVHDLVYLRYPETVNQKILRTQKKRLAWVKKESKVIFADSQATKKDLVDLLQIDSKKVFVNYPGVNVLKPTKYQINQTLKKYNLTKPFILTVGKLEPRKNIAKLIEAMKQANNLPGGRQGETIKLVIVGPKGWEDLKQWNNLPGGRQGGAVKQSNIRFLNYVSDFELFSFYSSCLFFIYPSIWEGFGFPIVEAMKLGVPVATSNTSSLKEIAQGAGLLFNPSSVDEMYHCINTMIHDEKLRGELSSKGLERSKIFTWLNYYNRMIKVLSNY